MDELLNIINFRPLADMEKIKLDFKGLYSLRVKNISVLPNLFKQELISTDTELIYIGKGERTLFERLEEECRGKSNGTFFRGIGALLNFRPPTGSLIGMSNTNNYRFSKPDREYIVDWMNENLDFNFIKLENNIEAIEKKLISINCPILNTTHNPKKPKLLAELRKECRQIGLTVVIKEI